MRRRVATDGWTQTSWHNATRYLGIIGIGTILVAGEIIFGQDPSGINWGVLQAIGAAGLLTLLVIWLPTWARAAIGVALLAVYQVLLTHGWLAIVFGSPHGGIQGAVDWTAMLILATVLADLFHDANGGRKWFLGNPFLLYVLHQVLLGIFVLPGIAGWYATAPGWLVVLQAVGLLAALFAVAWWLEKKKLVFSF